MLDEKQRIAILALHEQGHGSRAIAKALGVSRGGVRDVLKANTAQVPTLARTQKGEAHHALIIELYGRCKGNLVRVYDLLEEEGASLSYQALTAYCRRHGIGHAPKIPVAVGHPRSRRARTKASNSRSPSAYGAASTKLGRRWVASP